MCWISWNSSARIACIHHFLHWFQESKVLFHVIGLKCQHCGSYNTCRTEDPDSKMNGTPSGGAEGSNTEVPSSDDNKSAHGSTSSNH